MTGQRCYVWALGGGSEKAGRVPGEGVRQGLWGDGVARWEGGSGKGKWEVECKGKGKEARRKGRG